MGLLCIGAEVGGKGGVVEFAALIVFAQEIAHNDEGGFGNACRAGALGERSDGAAHGLLLRPGGLIDYRCRGLFRVGPACQQGGLHVLHKADGEKEDHGSPMGGKGDQLFPLGHRGAALHPGDDDGLADGGQGVLGAQSRRRAAETGNARRVVVGNAHPIQCVHLLPDGPVKAGVAGVETDGGLACGFHPAHHGKHLLQRHLGAVINGAAGSREAQQGRVDKAARIDDAIGRLQQRRAALGDEIGRAGACPHKMDHNISLLYDDRCKIARRPGGVVRRKIGPERLPRQAAIAGHGRFFQQTP